MRSIAIAIAALVLGGCYGTPASNPSCTLLCTQECPDDMACVNGYCVAAGERCEPTFQRVVAGNGFACALDSFHRRWCWGSNDQHQLDDSDRTTLVYATVIDGPWDDITAGGDHVCGLLDGALYCWGSNDRQQISGTISGDAGEPLKITAPNGMPWSSVIAGYATTCGIAGGRLYCWGANNNGQVGVRGTVDVGIPTEIASTLTDWTLVAVGRDHTCAVSESAGLHCWGYNGYGELGNGVFIGTPTLPVPVALPGVTAIAAAGYSTCAVAADRLYCWGRAGSGALGDPAVVPPVDACTGAVSTPVLASQLTGWSHLTASREQVCGLHDGQLWCWGATTSGLGNGIWGSIGWMQVADGVTDVSVGWNPFIDDTGVETADLDLTCFIANGAIRCWGDNRHGQLAQGTASMAAEPVEIAGSHVWSQLETGDSHMCGIANGTPLCWGTNRSGQLDGVTSGGSNKPCGSSPDVLCATGAPVALPDAARADAIKAGDDHTCVLDGMTLTCFGNNAHGQLGALAATSPNVITGAWTGLYGPGGKGQCASQSGQTWCWGSVTGTRQPIVRDTRLDNMLYIGITSFIGDATLAGNQRTHGCALDSTHKLSCFGVDTHGQFGRGPPTASCGNLICELGESESLCAVDCSGKRTCTTNSCGATSCSAPCGDGACNYAYGETCSSCASDCGACPFVALGRSYDSVAVGWNSGTGFTCAVRTDRQVECWGRNNNGQAGALDDTGKLIDPVYIPNVIAGLSECTAVSAGGSTACAICSDEIYCWGNHRTGAVGAGRPTAFPIAMPRKVEIDLADGDRFVQLVSGEGFNCARSELGRGFCWGFHSRGAVGAGGTSMNVPVPVLTAP